MNIKGIIDHSALPNKAGDSWKAQNFNSLNQAKALLYGRYQNPQIGFPPDKLILI